MANRIDYQIVGRYMDGNEVTGYHMLSTDSSKSARYTREQVCYLVGRGQVTNCSGQIYKDKVLLRGVGMSLEDLPVQKESGEISRTDNVGKIRRGDTTTDIMTKLNIVKAIINGRNTIGYVLANTGGGTHNYTREQTMQLAKDGKIGNARYQNYKEQQILRGVDVDLNKLPTVTAQELGLVKPNTAAQQTTQVQQTPKVQHAPKVSQASQDPTKNKFSDKLTEKEKSAIAVFKSKIAESFNAFNNSDLVKNKLVNMGFSGLEIDPSISDYTPLERFDFGISGKATECGGFIDLVRDNNVLRMTFNYCAYEGEDLETKVLGTSTDGIKAGWMYILSGLKNRGAI